MGKLVRWLRDQWEQIRGNAKWCLFSNPYVWGVIVGGLTAIWGWIISLPGPAIFCLSLAVVALGIFITNGVQEYRFRRKQKRGEPTLPDKPVLLLPPLPATSSLLLTGAQATDLIEQFKRISGRIPIKIVSTLAYMELAKDLVKVFRTANYQFVINEKKNEEIFPAEKEHGTVVVRYWDNKDNPYDLTCNLLFLILLLSLHAQEKKFPTESPINYFQIELGGEP
jgi:hypothetical protein